MKSNQFVLLAFLFVCMRFTAQNETTKWIFGNYAGLDFISGTPITVTGPTMYTSENCASIADAAGNLLFYTNSENIWNSTHNIMANGASIMGNNSTTQSMIVKQPGSASIYHVFTIDDAGGPDGLRYSTVDMSLAAGMGSVTVKNVLLYTPSTEKVTAVRHCNGTDIWVLSHDLTGNGFKAHLVTAAGVSLTPVVSNIGFSYAGANWGGQMKFSPNGRKLGVSAPAFEIYDFNNSTGQLSGLQTLTVSNNTGAYSCEFSPDGTKFYAAITLSSTVVQWDLCANNATTAIQSQFSGLGNYFGSLQLAPDGKIYVTRASNATLGVINNPNAAGAACNYSDMGPTLALNGMVQPTGLLGLPAFLPDNFRKPPVFTYTANCQNVSFTAPPQLCPATGALFTSMAWNFGDPASGSANQSQLVNPVHAYSGTGSYTATMILYYPCAVDTVKIPVTINSSGPSISVAGSFTICKGQSATYTASGGNGYNWSTGSNNLSITVTPTSTTVYSVTATHTVNSCQAAKSFTVFVSPCTGIEQIQAITGNKLLVYPNPTQGKLTVETEKEGRLMVYNQLGELIIEQTVSAGKNSLDLSRTSNGIYFLKYSCSTGEKMARLIKAD
jgi:hypothetical protein